MTPEIKNALDRLAVLVSAYDPSAKYELALIKEYIASVPDNISQKTARQYQVADRHGGVHSVVADEYVFEDDTLSMIREGRRVAVFKDSSSVKERDQQNVPAINLGITQIT